MLNMGALTILNKQQDWKLIRGQERPPEYRANARNLPLSFEEPHLSTPILFPNLSGLAL